MLRTIFLLGLVLIVGGALFGIVVGLTIGLLALAIKVLIIGAVAYLILRLVSPRTADNLRAKWR